MSGTDALPAAREFAQTRWSLVLAAGRESSDASAALDELCRAYWFPLYAFVRRRGYQPHDAQDLTQEFFARVLEKRYLARADRSRGRFRTFLLSCLKNFLANEWDRERAQKRGGDIETIALDEQLAESLYQREGSGVSDAETLFARRWALALMERVLDRLAADYDRAGKSAVFDALKGCLTGAGLPPHDDLAASLGVSVGSLKVLVHRLRHRYRELFREEVAQTVHDPADTDEELRYLVGVLAG